MENLNGKKALITGGTTGIGRASAKLITKSGAYVIIFGRHEKELKEAISEIEPGGNVFGLTADVSKPEDIQKIFEKVDEQLGGLDILVNNAAIGAESIENTNLDNLNYILKTDLVGYLLCSKEALKRFGEIGHIVNISSLSSKVIEKGSDIYVLVKSAIDGFSDSLRKVVNERNVKVTVIRPGLTSTSLFDMNEEERKKLLKEEKILQDKDIAETILFALTRPNGAEVMQIDIKPTKQIL